MADLTVQKSQSVSSNFDGKLQKIKDWSQKNETSIWATAIGASFGAVVGGMFGKVEFESIADKFENKAFKRCVARGWTETVKTQKGRQGIFARPTINVEREIIVPDLQNGQKLVSRYRNLGIKKGFKAGLLCTAAGAILGGALGCFLYDPKKS